MESLDQLLSHYASHGHIQYAGEPVDQLGHAWQTLELAKRGRASPTLQLAAFFHDIGHLLDEDQVPHERAGSAVLAAVFGPSVACLVSLHVEAKRYLVSKEPGYVNTLSEDSVRSLRRQGGPMTAEEMSLFEKKPGADQAILLRRWDEEAKNGEAITPPLPIIRMALLDSIDELRLMAHHRHNGPQ